jgi:YHS domain-containing protein
MLRHGRITWKRVLATASVAAAMVSTGSFDAQAQLPDASPAADTVPLQPSLLDFLTGAPVSAKMQDLAKPKLLQKAFAKLPKADPKGLAAIIKAKEVDVANRVAAAKYLGKVDCQQFPESQLALKDLLLDEFEPVRYQAALALQQQFGRGPDEFSFPWQGKSKRKDACRGCCNTDNIQAVIDVMHDLAFGCDDYGCPNEPSLRVQQVLSDAIKLCVHCECQEGTPTYAEPLEPAVEPTVNPDSGEAAPASDKPALPAAPTEGDSAPAKVPAADGAKPALPAAPANTDSSAVNDQFLPPLPEVSPVSYENDVSVDELFVDNELFVDAASQLKTMDQFKGNCIVEIVDNQGYLKASESISVPYKGMFDNYRVYLSSEYAQAKFRTNPENYFPVLDGYCVATWIETGKKVKGTYFAKHNGRCYCFATETLGNEFGKDPGAMLKQLDQRLQGLSAADDTIDF